MEEGRPVHKWLLGSVAATVMVFGAPVLAQADTTGQTSFGNPVATVLKLFLFLGIIVVLAVLSIRYLAKRTQVAQKGGIQVVAARQVAPNRSVQVIDVQGKRYLIGVGDQVTLLAEMELDSELVPEDGPELAAGRPFGRVLADALSAVRGQYSGRHADKEES